LPNPIAATIFVDAGIPIDGASRLDLLKLELPEAAGSIQQQLEQGHRLPQWTADDLQDEIPNSLQRQQMLQELHPRPLAFFTEPLPVPAEWPDHPCFYIQFTTSYDYSAADARARGWEVKQVSGGHFHMLVNPAAVVNTLLEFTQYYRRGQHGHNHISITLPIKQISEILSDITLITHPVHQRM
jgi:hypothetical protein